MAGENKVMPPWATTLHTPGRELLHPTRHAAIGHPNREHGPRDAATPFIDGAGAMNGIRGNARHWPDFIGRNPLSVGPRK